MTDEHTTRTADGSQQHPIGGDPSPASSVDRIERIVGREVRTVARTRTFAGIGVAVAVVVLGLTWVSGGASAGYVPSIVALLTPLELLVPMVAVAFGYRAIVGDESRGELDVLSTYPLRSGEQIAGVFVGRAIGLLVVVIVPLLVVGVLIALFVEPPIRLYATSSGVDSPLLYARFVILTALFAVTVLAVAIAISALASGGRSALALAIIALLALLVGIDLLIVYGLASGYIGDSSLVHTLAFSPLSAYRGLVFETVVVTAAGTGPQTAAPLSSVAGLLTWTVGSLAGATWAVRR